MADVTNTHTVPLTEAAPTYGGVIPAERMPQRQQRLRELLQERDEAHARARALWAANRRMEQFLGMAAHEIRNPVTSSRLGVRLAARQLDPLVSQLAAQAHDGLLASQFGTVRDLLMGAEADLERLVRLVGDLLDVSRLHTGTGQLALHPTRVDLRTIVRMAVDEQRHLAPTRRMRLHLPARQAFPVWVDADRIHQVVTNFLTNALKYAPSDRPVDVRVQVQVRNRWARVSVRDQGPGLPDEEQERIWEPFHQAAGIPVVGGTLHAAAQSLGLGLYMCRSIIEQQQGRVGVHSTPGQGATFWFALPQIGSQREEPLPSASDAP
jgi:signal transduction histidine kinase